MACEVSGQECMFFTQKKDQGRQDSKSWGNERLNGYALMEGSFVKLVLDEWFAVILWFGRSGWPLYCSLFYFCEKTINHVTIYSSFERKTLLTVVINRRS